MTPQERFPWTNPRRGRWTAFAFGFEIDGVPGKWVVTRDGKKWRVVEKLTTAKRACERDWCRRQPLGRLA